METELNCGNGEDEDNEKARRETFRFSSRDSCFRLIVPFKWVTPGMFGCNV